MDEMTGHPFGGFGIVQETTSVLVTGCFTRPSVKQKPIYAGMGLIRTTGTGASKPVILVML